MHLKICVTILAALILAGCAQKGVVVEKRLKPSPFAYSNGMDGIYSFLLRDEQGHVHSQMVPPDVFNRYEIGDMFDDQQAGPAHRESGFSKDSTLSDSKSVKPVTHVAPKAKAVAHVAPAAKPLAHAAPHKKHPKAVAVHHKKQLRAVAKQRDDAADDAEKATVGVMMRMQTPEPQALEVHP